MRGKQVPYKKSCFFFDGVIRVYLLFLFNGRKGL